MANMDSCFHCTEKLLDNQYSCTINNNTCYFCCPACLAITQTIFNSGFDSYYQQRDNKPKRLPRHHFDLWNNPTLQMEFVSHHGNQFTAELYIEGLHCTSCAWLIEKHLAKQKGIVSASLNFQQQHLTLQWNEDLTTISRLMEAIADIGYLPHPWQANTIKELQEKEKKKLLKQIGITAILMMQIGMFSIGIYAGEFVGISKEYHKLLSLFSLLFSIPLLYFSARPFFTAALLKLKNRQLSIDVSISIAIIGLYASSVYSVITQTGEFYFDSIAMFCLFILIARFIEKQSRTSLLTPNALLPSFATRIRQQLQESVIVSSLLPGDTVLIRPGETLPIDGVVENGASSVNEAFLHGEPNPVKKAKGDIVYAGSINHDGEFTLQVTQTINDSFVKKIEALSHKAAQEKPSQQSYTDQIASKFTIIVYLLAIGTFLYWYQADNSQAFWIALSVLVISCPCALSLAAPTALSTVQHSLRQQGILIQSPHVIEKIRSISDVIFDKTGTLTEGRYSIASITLAADLCELSCLQTAHALESTSRHPIAKAFTEQGLHASQHRLFPNQGIEATIDNHIYRIGHAAFCAQWHTQCTAPNSSEQWIGLCNEHSMLAWFAISDKLRSDALPLSQFLQQQHITTHILSGDPSNTVNDIAKLLGIHHFRKACSSQDKLQHIQQLQSQGKRCMMIGDGVNDAPVLAQSDISVTLIEACDWVKNSTDIILLNSELNSIQTTFAYAKRYQRIVWQNFAWALCYNSLTIPIAMAGLITPYWAALGMSLSSIAVVVNSRRLRKRL